MDCKIILKSGKNKGNVCGKVNCKNHNKKEPSKETPKKEKNQSKKHINKDRLREIFEIVLKYNNDINNFNKKNNCKMRKIGLPEIVSENMIKYFLIEHQNINCNNSSVGDLHFVEENKTIKIECKCFTSTGPMSFGPTENWNVLICLDAINLNKYKLYKIDLSNNSNEWKNMKITNNKTFEEAIKNKNNRPRFSFDKLCKNLDSKHISILFEGSFEEMINKPKNK